MVKIVYRTCRLVKNRITRTLVIVLLICSTVLVMKRSLDIEMVNYSELNSLELKIENEFDEHLNIVTKYYEKRMDWKTSNLGSILFKNFEPNVYENGKNYNKTFKIVVWRYWNWLRRRHILNFGSYRDDPLEGCSVKNCKFVPEKQMKYADAVLIHMQKGVIPVMKNRSIHQRWVFLSDESPINTFSLARKQPKLSELENIFNWTMTYSAIPDLNAPDKDKFLILKSLSGAFISGTANDFMFSLSDSDVPVPYGRTLPLPSPIMRDLSNVTQSLERLVPHWQVKRRDALAAILISNCKVKHRMYYLNELKQHIRVNIHGKCSNEQKDSCPGGFKADCKVMSKYLFYLVFENSRCRQYISEKVFYNAYSKGAIPVILGPPLKDCNLLLPPNSFLHVDNYETPAELAEAIIRISKSQESLLSLHRWRNHFKVANEHGFFGSRSYHYCRLCEALNYNTDKPNAYSLDDLRLFFDSRLTCV